MTIRSRSSVIRYPLGLGLAAATFLLSCGGGSSGASNPAPVVTPPSSNVTPPTNVAVTYDPVALRATLTWTPPAVAVDGYQLIGGLQGQSFVQISSPLIPGIYNAATLQFIEAPPELGAVNFIMRSELGGAYSAESNTASFTAPLLAPDGLWATPSTVTPAMVLAWNVYSYFATDTTLERATVDASGQSSGWTLIADQPTATPTYTDTQVQESVAYSYRATNTVGTFASLPTYSATAVCGPFAPTGLTATPAVGSISLSWTNHSGTATAIQINRSNYLGIGATVLTLPPTATSYVDGSLGPGQYTYYLTITDGVRTTSTGLVASAPLNPAGAPTLQGTPVVTVSNANAAALTGAVGWLTGYAGVPLASVYPPPGAAWKPWAVSDDALVGDGFLAADPQGDPHMVYGSSTTAANLPDAFVHTWFDGEAWTSEMITAYDGSGFGFVPALCIDGTGTPKVVASGGTGSGSWADLRYFTRTGGIWTTEAIGTSLSDASRALPPWFGLDPAGQPHLMLTQVDSQLEVNRGSDGTWSATTLTDPYFTGDWRTGKAVWIDNNTAWFIFPSLAQNYQIRAMAKVAGVWQPSVLIDSFEQNPTYDVAITPDGSRLAVAIAAERGPVLYLRNVQGWLGASIPVANPNSPVLRVGFDAGGHLHVLLLGSPAMDWHE